MTTMTTTTLQVLEKDDDIIEFDLLGFSFRGPRHEAVAITARVQALVAEAKQAEALPGLLSRLDEVERQHRRAITDLDAVISAAARATRDLS
jgi:hypothetical protein